MADQYSGSDVARLTMDGVNAGTTFTDSLAHTFTAAGAGATTSTANAKYGTASMQVTGVATAYISAPTSVDWNMGAGDFCMDCWIYPTALTNANSLVCAIGGAASAANASISINSNGAIVGTIIVGGTTKTITGQASNIVLNRWQHVALVRSGINLSIYVNGSSRATDATLSTTAITFSSDLVYVGGSAFATATGSYTGYIDQFRLTKGQARYTTAFIPPLDLFNQFSTAVTYTTLGTYTKQVTTVNETNHDAIISQINQAVIDLGWSVYDTYYKNGGGQTIMIYRSLMKDATNYKYAVLFIDKMIYSFHLTCCESWDLVNQTMTNEAWSSGRSPRQGYAMTGCDIIIFGSTRHLGITTYIQNSGSATSILCEIERDAPEDTAVGAFPSYGMWYSTAQHAWIYNIDYRNTKGICIPRSKDGRVGYSASNNQTLITSVGAFGYMGQSSTKWGQIDSSNTLWNPLKHGWDTTKKIVTSFKLVENDNSAGIVSVHGRLYGIKGTSNSIGNQFDKVQVPVDSDMFYASGGTATDHWILNCHFDAALYNTPTTVWSTNGAYTPTSTAWAQSQIYNAMCFTGQFIYAATVSGMLKCDITNGTSTVVTGPSGILTDICYDGKYVYAASSTGVSRIDTTAADAHATLTIGTGGLQSICWDGGGRLYASQRTTSTTPNVYCIDCSTFTQLGSTMIPSARTSVSVLNGLAAGDTNILGAYVSATAADMLTLVITPQLGVSWGPVSGTQNATNIASMTWQGQYFGFSYMSTAAATGCGSATYNTAGTRIAEMAVIQNMPGVLSNANSSRIVQIKTDGYTMSLYPSTSTTSKSVIVVDYGAVYALQQTSQETTVGGYSINQAIKAGYYTYNNLFVQGTDLNLYHIRNPYQADGTWNGNKQAQFLLPK